MLQKLEAEETLPNSCHKTRITLITNPNENTAKNYRPIVLMNINTKILNKVLTN